MMVEHIFIDIFSLFAVRVLICSQYAWTDNDRDYINKYFGKICSKLWKFDNKVKILLKENWVFLSIKTSIL